MTEQESGQTPFEPGDTSGQETNETSNINHEAGEQIPVAAAVPAGLSVAQQPGMDLQNQNAGSLDAMHALEQRRQKRRRKILIRVGVAAAILALLGVGSMVMGNINATQQQENAFAYEPVSLENYTVSVTAQGSTRPNQLEVVTPELEGTIEEVFVTEGQYVEQGQQLLTLNSPSVDKLVADADRAVRNAEQQVNRAYDAAVRAYQADAESGADAATALGPAAQAELDSAYEALVEAQEKYQETQNEAAKKSVTAPASGTVTVMNAVKGAHVGGSEGLSRTGGSGSSSDLIQIADLSTMRVEVQVNEADVPKIQGGQEASISFSALEDLKLIGWVEHIATVATSSDAGGGGGYTTYAVEVVIPEPDERIKPGMTASVDIVVESRPDSLVVPANAVQTDESGATYVEVLVDQENKTLEKRAVQVVTGSSGVQVVEGNIAAGDLLAVPLPSSASAGSASVEASSSQGA